jgi:nitrous oxidase accessory protein NosD
MSAAIADRITAIAATGDQVVVGLGPAGLAVLDTASLATVSTLPLPGYAESVVVADTLAYVADGPGGLRIVDIRNPAVPIEVGRELALHRIMDVAVAGELAFAAAADEGLFMLDVADPTRPRTVGRLYTGGYTFAVEHTAGRLVVADGWAGVALVDVSDPAAPSVVANVPTTGWAMDVALDGGRAAVAAGNELLVLAGVAAGRLDEAGRVALPAGRAEKVDLAGGLVALSDQSAGITFYDAGAGQPFEIGAFDPLTRGSGLEVVGDRAFVAALGQGLRVIDIGDPAAPVEQSPILAADSVNSVAAVAGSVLFTTAPLEGSPYVGSLHTLGAPERVVSMNVPLGLWLDADGSLLFAAAEQEVLIVGTAPDEAACLLGRLATKDFETGAGFEANDISVVGDTAFVAGYYDEIHVIDVGDPREPNMVDARPQMDGLGVGQLLAIGSTLYTLAADAKGPLMAIFDVSDRAEPSVMGRVRLPAETGRQDASGPTLAYGAGYLFVADGTAGLVAIDVSDPRRPVIVGQLALPGDAVAVAVLGEHAYVATDGGAFFVIDVTPVLAVAASARSFIAADRSQLARQQVVGANGLQLALQQVVGACVVTSIRDEGPGTLRDCLAGAGDGTKITFDPTIFPARRPSTIEVGQPYEVPSGATIDSTGAGVIVDGGHEVATGFSLESDAVVRGLVVTGFTEAGVVVHGENNLIADNVLSDNGYAGAIVDGASNRLVGNLVGLDPSGRRLMGSQTVGLFVGSNQTIGGPAPEDRNVITGEIKAIFLKTSRGVVIEGNYIGTDISGNRALGVGEGGRTITVEVGSHGNHIVGNVVAGTISLIDPGSSYNTIVGNRIGIGADGRPMASGGGVAVDEPFNRIGGTLPGEGNLVNGGFDINTANSIVLGNRLGVDLGGSPSGEGSIRTTRPRTIIGGASVGAANHMSAFGISLHSADNLVIGNSLGLVEAPDLAGVVVAAGSGNQVVLNRLRTRNGFGVLVAGDARSTLVLGNVFDVNGVAAHDEGVGTAWDDGQAGNYWSGFDAPDANADGVLDEPRRVPSGSADRFPLADRPGRWRP